MTWTHERQRIRTGLQTQGDYIGRQTRVTRETQLEPLKQWLSNKMGGDRQSTWEHMAPNKQQAMCSTHRDTGGQPGHTSRDRDITPPFKERIPDAPHTLNRKCLGGRWARPVEWKRAWSNEHTGVPGWGWPWSGLCGFPDRSGVQDRSGLHGLPDRSGLWSGVCVLPD